MTRRRLPGRAIAGAAMAAASAGAALLAPLVSGRSPSAVSLKDRFRPPCREFLAGADDLGRDVLARSLHGGRVSLLVGLLVVTVSLSTGLLLGATAGFLGGWADAILMRLVDVLMAFPGILLAIAMVAVLGPSLPNAVAALVAIGWVGYARLARAQALRIRELEYVQSCVALGGSRPRIVLHHVIPNLLGPMVVQASLGVAGAILAEASLSFLGLSVQPPAASWGTMLNEGRQYLDAPHLTILPGLLLMLTVLAFNFIGDGLRDYLDPRAARG
ncbi:MAG: ABC transporter permease [Acidobacteriota bacterium]